MKADHQAPVFIQVLEDKTKAMTSYMYVLALIFEMINNDGTFRRHPPLLFQNHPLLHRIL